MTSCVFFLLSGCARGAPEGGGAPQQEALIPEDVKNEILSTYTSQPKDFRNVQLEITGAGNVLPDEKNQGVDTIVCFKIRKESYIGGDNWRPDVTSHIAQRIGNYWGSNQVYSEDKWNRHSCPGKFEHAGF